MDISLCLDLLIPNADYRGVFINNDEKEYKKIIWEDVRDKPLWSDIESANLINLKNKKLEWLTNIHLNTLTAGYLTQFGFTVDCKSEDISNWTAALNLLELLPYKIEKTYQLLLETGMTNYDIFITICQTFYEGSELYNNIDISWTLTMFTDFILDNYEVFVGDYYNTIPPHKLSIIQFKLMCIEVGTYYQSMFNKKWNLRNIINLATTESDLDIIVWE